MTNSFPTDAGNFSAFRSAERETADREIREPGGDRRGRVENTNLERRVLAHERILQALISHIAEAQPEILARLKTSFGTGHNLGEFEHDHISTEHYGDQFIRSIEDLVTKLASSQAGQGERA